jgi:Fe-S-cluster containining protein
MSNPCATCGRCCRSYVVSVCGYDVWRICTQQRIGPEEFLVACPQTEPSRDGFLLDAEGPTFGLMLDKQGPLKATQPCVFLMKLGGGHERCGIYAHRPVVCQAYPMALVRRDVVQRDDVLCPPDAWPAAAVQRPGWRAALQRQRMHFDVYRQVVLRWNARVVASPGRHFATGEYFAFLLNVYDRLARLDADLGEDGRPLVEDGWGLLPGATEGERAGGAPAAPRQVNVSPEDCPWLEHLLRVKSVIDDFFPHVERQPLRLPSTVYEADKPAPAMPAAMVAAGPLPAQPARPAHEPAALAGAAR